jgi:hypothetical protein
MRVQLNLFDNKLLVTKVSKSELMRKAWQIKKDNLKMSFSRALTLAWYYIKKLSKLQTLVRLIKFYLAFDLSIAERPNNDMKQYYDIKFKDIYLKWGKYILYTEYNFNWSGTLVESYCERALKGDFGFVKELKAQGYEQDNGKLFLAMA